MIENKIKVLSEIYVSALSPFAITDQSFNVLWTNNSDVFKPLKDNNIKSCIDFPLNFDEKSNSILTATVNDSNFTINLLPIFENSILEGYLINFVNLKHIIKHQINKDFSEYQIENFANVREQISGIITSATLLHDSLERMELYDELKLLNQQINYCYKILASILNPTEIAKYSFGLHNIVKVNASIFLNDILSIVKTLLRGNDVAIDYECDENIFINVDLDRFVVLILNFIINSLQYNFEEKKKIHVTLRKSSDYATLSITDNGCGISSTKLNEIFENIRNDKLDLFDLSKKIGLGYQIAEFFCNNFNSTMYLSSKENVGTTVSLKIPLSSENEVPFYIESKTADYFTNRFSSIYVALSQVSQINYF